MLRRASVLASLLTLAACAPSPAPRTTTSARGLTMVNQGAPASAPAPSPSPYRVVVQQGMKGVRALAIRPDGKLAVVASSDTLKVWHLESGRELRTLVGHAKEIHDVALSPDGARFATVSEDGTLRLWTWDDVRPEREIPLVNAKGYPMTGRRVAFSGDGTRLFVRLADRSLGSWDPVTGERRSVLPKVGNSELAVSPAGLVAVGDDEGKVHVVDAEGASERAVIAAHSGAVTELAASRDGTSWITAGEDGVKVWDVATGRLLRTLPGATGKVHALAVSPIDGTVVAVDWRGTLLAWSLADGTLLASYKTVFPAQLSGSYGIAVNPTTGAALVGAGDGTLATWRRDATAPMVFSRTDSDYVETAYHPGRDLLAVSDGHLVQTLRLSTGAVESAWNLPDGGGQLAFTSDGARLAVATPFAGVVYFDVKTGAPGTRLQASLVGGLRMSPDGRRIVVRAGLLGAEVWSAEDGTRLLVGPGGMTMCAEPNADGSRLLTGGFNEPLRVTRVDDGQVLFTIRKEWKPEGPAGDTAAPLDAPAVPGLPRVEESYFACTFVEGDRTIAAATAGGPIHLFDGRTGAFVRALAGRGGSAQAFAEPAPGKLLTGTSEGEITLWDLASGRAVATFARQNSGIKALAMHADGKRFLATGSDRTVREFRLDDPTPDLTFVPLARNDGPGTPYRPASVVVDRAGFFDFHASEGLELVHLVKDSEVVSLSQLAELFYVPDLVARTRSGAARVKEYDWGGSLRLPPKVELEARATSAGLEVVSRTRGAEGAVAEWMLFRNSRLVLRERVTTPAVPGSEDRRTWTVPPLPGKNTFLAVGRTEDGIKTYSNKVALTVEGENTSPRALHVVAVGIDRYGSGTRAEGRGGTASVVRKGARGLVGDLEFAAGDARDVAAKLVAGVPSGSQKVAPRLLLDAQATRTGILRALSEVAKTADDNDTVVVFLAGHGVSVDRRVGNLTRRVYLYVPSDYGSVETLAETGLSSDELLAALGAIPAANVVLMLDTCESGASSDAFANDVFGALRLFGEDSGLHVMASASVKQSAVELTKLRHGAFTYALLDALTCTGGAPLTFRRLAGSVGGKLDALLGTSGRQNMVVSSGEDDPVLAACAP